METSEILDHKIIGEDKQKDDSNGQDDRLNEICDDHCHLPPHKGISDHDDAYDHHEVNDGDAGTVKSHGDDNGGGKYLESIVEHSQRETGPDKKLMYGAVVSSFHKAQGCDHPAPPPEMGYEITPEKNAYRADPVDDDGDNAVFVGDLTIYHKQQGAE